MSDTPPYVEFRRQSEDQFPESIPRPQPPVSALPTWYKMLEGFLNSDDPTSSTVKMCRPFADALKLGFLIPVPEDIELTKQDHGHITTSAESVDVYGPSQYESEQNSRYLMPEVKIKNPWQIRTPPGYSVLITKPLNREAMVPGFKPNALYVPSDSYEGPINIPVSLTEDHVSLSKGDPLVQVIPLKRERMLTETRSYAQSDRPTETERYQRLSKRQPTRPDLYRSLQWVQKPATHVLDESEATDQGYDHTISEGVTSSPAGGESDTGEMSFITADQNYGVIPEPVPGNRVAPPWLGDLPEILGGVDGPGDDELRFQSWMSAAIELGAVTRTHAFIEFIQSDGGLDWKSRYDGDSVAQFQPEALGDGFPLPYSFPNMLSEWIADLPLGYSNLYVEPFLHHQQYYRAYAGIVDDDRYRDKMNAPGKYVTEETTVEMEARTPVCQVIPIHRESLISTGVVREI